MFWGTSGYSPRHGKYRKKIGIEIHLAGSFGISFGGFIWVLHLVLDWLDRVFSLIVYLSWVLIDTKALSDCVSEIYDFYVRMDYLVACQCSAVLTGAFNSTSGMSRT